MAELSWGVKRTCNACGVRFYDLRKNPVVCPKCGAICELQATNRSKKEKNVVKESALPLDDFDLTLDNVDQTVVDPALLEDDQGFGDLSSDLGEEVN